MIKTITISRDLAAVEGLSVKKWLKKYFTEQEWGRRQNYHLSIDRGLLGIEKAAALIVSAAGGGNNE